MNQENHEEINKKTVKDILDAVKGIKFGYVQVIVQDSKIVQIDRTEKIRLHKEGGGE